MANKKKILIVEDDIFSRFMMKKIIETLDVGLTVDVANDGISGCERIESDPGSYALVLMDIHMPGISGVEATEQIRCFDPETPIIALTAISLDDRLETFFAAGCNEVVTKPFKPEVFYRKIGEYIVVHKRNKTLI